MRATLARASLISLLLLATDASGQSLKPPDNLVDLRSPQGESFLLETRALDAYFPISVAFETQKTQAYCGVASMVMALNALGVPAPSTPEFQPYAIFTQDNVLNDKTETILPRDVLAHHGMTLDQLGRILSLYPVAVEVHHATAGGVDEFRKLASEALASEHRFVIVNFLRKALGEERGGHISPLGAYDEKADRFLIFDVARYKYPPVWVENVGAVRRHEHDGSRQRQQDTRIRPCLGSGLRGQRASAMTLHIGPLAPVTPDRLAAASDRSGNSPPPDHPDASRVRHCARSGYPGLIAVIFPSGRSAALRQTSVRMPSSSGLASRREAPG